MKKSCLKGHGLVEYSLIGLLVLGICMIGLNRLSSSLEGNLEDFHRSLVRKKSDNASKPFLANNNALAPGNPTEQSQLKAQESMSPEQTISSIQVMGANGATKELASTLENRIKQLVESGKITESQANLLFKLANRGHYMANAEKAVDDTIEKTQDTVNFEGKEYSIWDLGVSLGVGVGTWEAQQKVEEMMAQANNAILLNGKRYDASLMANGIGLNVRADGTGWDMNPMFASYSARPFFEAYQEAKQSGALNDPAIAGSINKLVLQIATIGDSFAQSVLNLQYVPQEHWGQYRQQFNNYTAQSFVNNLSTVPIDFTVPTDDASEFTHGMSREICQKGNGEDEGRWCTSE